MKKNTLSLCAAVMICFSLSPTPVFALSDIINVRHWTAPDNTRIVIDTGSEARYDVQEKDQKLVIDIFHSELLPDVALEYPLNVPAVKGIQVVPLPGDTTRVEVALGEQVVAKVFTLGQILDKPHRIVIDVRIPEVEQREADERIRIADLEAKRIVVIDPGHGGEDPGAIGRLGTREKDIVLMIARELRTMLAERGYQVFLTRDGDYFVSLEQRGRIARQYNADLFISIHADAAPVRSARGSSVYCLSTIGASNEAARLLAASQNLSDILGGDPGTGGNDEADPIILNMLQTESLNQSRSFGSIALANLKRANDLKFATVQGAPFRVLKLPDITSVLVETAYLSNYQEELLLKNTEFRKDIAWAIAASVTEYLPNQVSAEFRERDVRYRPQSPSIVLAREEITYTVRKGDRLERIAVDHGTTVRTLMEMNNIRSRDRIYVGQQLNIPGGGLADVPEPTPAVYTVEAGDTLERVARRYGVSMTDLARMNSIRSHDLIYVGQRLTLKSAASSSTASAAPDRPSTHVVARGDTLEQISRRYGVSMGELMRFNNIRSRDRIFVGQRLTLKSAASSSRASASPDRPSTHVIARGDTLERISHRYSVAVDDLVHANNLKSRNHIQAGQKIIIPAASDKNTGSVRKPEQLYTVSRGDTLGTIARRFGTSIETLMAANSLESRDRIFAGQQITIPR
ncbi:MAG: LysM peptidoglycan-binding domain-containing protein [Syntrophales bacterium]|jgi:N-acetylmuramoyl-L-alanine amidase|nr:LysM peptidoglycan-binding domain-containing protein [Syntrophales bacterium]MCK9528522.1 LysM peptidoglycan-binding domain-containing protein [Syntrophales bacterium]MDX9922852.1 LysM peptidoglycan-binding domain-containing protein [Syntrophales bacterium]